MYRSLSNLCVVVVDVVVFEISHWCALKEVLSSTDSQAVKYWVFVLAPRERAWENLSIEPIERFFSEQKQQESGNLRRRMSEIVRHRRKCSAGLKKWSPDRTINEIKNLKTMHWSWGNCRPLRSALHRSLNWWATVFCWRLINSAQKINCLRSKKWRHLKKEDVGSIQLIQKQRWRWVFQLDLIL